MARNIFCEVLPYLNIFMTEPLTEEDQKVLDDLQIEIRQDLENGVSGNDAEQTVSENGTDGMEGGESGEKSRSGRIGSPASNRGIRVPKRRRRGEPRTRVGRTTLMSMRKAR